MRLYIPRTALAGAATTTSSSQLRQLASSTTSRTSSLPSHLYRRFLALQLSPLQQLHKRVSPPLRCRCHVEGMGMSRGGGMGWIQERRIAATAVVGGKTVKKTSYPPRPKVKEEEIEEKFLKGSGPGGQKINKTNSAVQLRHISTGIVIKSQATRSREQNRKIARRILAEKLEELEKGGESRAAVIRTEEGRRKRSKEKKARRKYAKLATEENGGVVAAGAGSGAGAGAEDVGDGDDDIEDLEGKGKEWITTNEAYEDDEDDDDGDYDDDSEPSTDSSPDSELESDKPHSRKRPSPHTKTKDIMLEPEMSFDEEKEFLRLSREFARELLEEEAKREVAESNWRSEGKGASE